MGRKSGLGVARALGATLADRGGQGTTEYAILVGVLVSEG